jgi:hypothetical protein
MYYPQLPHELEDDTTAKVSINAGIVGAELSETPRQVSDLDRLDRVVTYLQNAGQVGTIESPRQFFRGQIRARSMISNPMLFFGGSHQFGDRNKYVGLTCSMHHMIGYEYSHIAENKPGAHVYQSNIGPTCSERYEGSSSNIGFTRLLSEIFVKERLLESVHFDVNEERITRLSHYSLSEDQNKIINRMAFLNPIISYIHTDVLTNLFRKGVLGLVFDPLFKLLLGRPGFSQKKEALFKQHTYKHVDLNRTLEDEDLQLLEAVISVTKNIHAPLRTYEFIAVKMLDGFWKENEVLLGSPLYVAIQY